MSAVKNLLLLAALAMSVGCGDSTQTATDAGCTVIPPCPAPGGFDMTTCRCKTPSCGSPLGAYCNANASGCVLDYSAAHPPCGICGSGHSPGIQRCGGFDVLECVGVDT